MRAVRVVRQILLSAVTALIVLPLFTQAQAQERPSILGPLLQASFGGRHYQKTHVQKGFVAQKGCVSCQKGGAPQKGCGSCQKGLVAQKGFVPQKGPIQKGFVAQKGSCGTCQKSAPQRGCGSCQKGFVPQKGVAQKGHVPQKGSFQKGHVVQKGPTQKGCVTCQKGKGGYACGSCSVCIPNPIPLVVHGVASLAHCLFPCAHCGATGGDHLCSIPSVRYQHGKGGKGKVKGKGKGSTIHMVDPKDQYERLEAPTPPNPFEDDPYPPEPSQPSAAARRQPLRPAAAHSARYAEPRRSSRQYPARTVQYSEPRSLDTVPAKPIAAAAEPRATVSRTSSGRVVPRNPLR